MPAMADGSGKASLRGHGPLLRSGMRHNAE